VTDRPALLIAENRRVSLVENPIMSVSLVVGRLRLWNSAYVANALQDTDAPNFGDGQISNDKRRLL
jgi:hypothetical protein